MTHQDTTAPAVVRTVPAVVRTVPAVVRMSPPAVVRESQPSFLDDAVYAEAMNELDRRARDLRRRQRRAAQASDTATVERDATRRAGPVRRHTATADGGHEAATRRPESERDAGHALHAGGGHGAS